MKKLMIGLVGALAMVASAEVASSNTVGFQNLTVNGGDRAMRSAATFLKTNANPLDIKISDIKQTTGLPGDLILCLYNDNVTRLAQYMYFSEEVAVEVSADIGMEISEGWYILDDNGDPDFESGAQDADLPYGQGCVIDSASSSAEYTSAGEVDSIKREFNVPGGARKMMGNVLPRKITLGELKQTEGLPGDFIFCTYNNNVTRLAQYMYFSDEVAEEVSADMGMEILAGWYTLDDNGDPDFDGGVQDFDIPSGQGFVIDSASSSAVLQFPQAI